MNPNHPSGRRSGARRTLVRGLLACVIGHLLAGGALPAVASPLAPAAQEHDVRDYDVPAGSLEDALNRLGRQAGVLLSFPGDAVAGLHSNGVHGSHTLRDALDAVLAGSGFSWRIQDGMVTLVRASEVGSVVKEGGAGNGAGNDGNAATFDTIEVQGQRLPETYTVPSTSSATKLDLAPKETPQSITTFTARQIQDQGLLTLHEVLEQTPGLTLLNAGPAGAGRQPVYARTFPVQAVQMDGVMASTYILSGSGAGEVGMQDSFLYEQIDIIRGSTSLTAGSGDPSASLNFVRKHPYADRRLHAAIKYGSWDTRRGEVDFSTPLNASGSLRTRIAAAYQQGDHWVDRVDSDSKTLSLIAALDINDHNRLSAGVTHYDYEMRGAAPVGITRFSTIIDNWPEAYRVPQQQGQPQQRVEANHAVERNFNNATPWSRMQRTYTNLFATYEHDFNDDWSFKLAYNYADNEDDSLYGAIGTTYFVDWADKASYSAQRKHGRNFVNAVDATLKGRFEWRGRKQEFLVGANYADLSRVVYAGHALRLAGSYLRYQCIGSYSLCTILPGRMAITADMSISDWMNAGGNIPMATNSMVGTADWDMTTSRIHHHINTRQTGYYFASHLRPLERTHLILGGRWARETLDYPRQTCHNGYTDTQCDGTNPRIITSNPDIRPKFLPYAGLIVELTPQINAYASHTSTYIRDNNFMNNRHYTTGDWLPPTRGITQEAGMKGAFFDDRLNAAVSWFKMKQRDFPSHSYDPNATGTSDGYRVYGYELNLAGDITPSWKISAGYVRQKQEVPPIGAILFSMSDNFTGSYRAPKHSFKLFTAHDVTDTFTLGMGLRWQGETQSEWVPPDVSMARETMRLGSYAVFDLMARYRLNDQFSVALNLNNAFDKIYYQHASSYITGAPRNALVTVNYSF